MLKSCDRSSTRIDSSPTARLPSSVAGGARRVLADPPYCGGQARPERTASGQRNSEPDERGRTPRAGQGRAPPAGPRRPALDPRPRRRLRDGYRPRARLRRPSRPADRRGGRDRGRDRPGLRPLGTRDRRSPGCRRRRAPATCDHRPVPGHGMVGRRLAAPAIGGARHDRTADPRAVVDGAAEARRRGAHRRRGVRRRQPPVPRGLRRPLFPPQDRPARRDHRPRRPPLAVGPHRRALLRGEHGLASRPRRLRRRYGRSRERTGAPPGAAPAQPLVRTRLRALPAVLSTLSLPAGWSTVRPAFLPCPGEAPAIALRRLQAGVDRALVTVCLVCGSGRQEDMSARWYEKAIIYCLDVDTFQDADGDGVGDFRGLIRRLDYLARLGVNCLWLNPIHPSPGRDDGYDVTDFYSVHPKLGTLGDFAEFLQAANSRGIRVMIDLVVNHTSDEHPWFVSARSSPDSPYRDWYVWSKT